MKNQKGFTLIELIIVIVVLGILAVTAAPQFINIGSDARVSTLQKIQGSMITASDFIYAKSLIAGNEKLGIQDADPATPADVTDDTYPSADGYDVLFGYPAPTADGIVAALNLSAADWDIQYSGLFKVAASLGPEIGDEVRISPKGRNVDSGDDTLPAVTPALDFGDITSCYISYIGPASSGAKPVITIVTSGC